ncbi:MAG: serine acetyltransferase [Verrucomicrobia bacterium]|nr:serine acetyltransferase [Verrucomicrobiota bacterium]
MNQGILQDWGANAGNIRSRVILVLFRLAQWFYRLPADWRWLGFPYLAFYEVFIGWVLGIELNHKASIGPGLKLFHGTALVIHGGSVIGSHCTLRHCTTIGMKSSPDDVPLIGDHVDVGCNSVIIGRIKIGDGAVIGAGSVVVKDVPAGAVVVGNPARQVHSGPSARPA